MPRIHDVMAVHGVGEQRRGDTLTRFAEQFYKGVRQLVQEAGENPNEVELLGRYQENRMEVHHGDEIFRLWEISWERSFQPPSASAVLDWLGLWSSQYLNRAFEQLRDQGTHPRGRGPWPRVLWLLALLLDLTLIAPLLAALLWIWTAWKQVSYQKAHDDQVDERILIRHRFATGLALTLSTPLIVGLHILARIGRAGAALPLLGGLADKMGQTVEDLVVGGLGDILLYVFDPVQSAFIRGDLERAIAEAHELAQKEKREPLIHIIGHSMGSVIAYEAASRSLDPELRRSVKTLCTMGTVLDMVRYILGGEGLVLAERVRFGQDIPREKQGAAYPRWLNLFARNDPATGFGPLLEFGKDPTNQPVRSTSKGHSTYWDDRHGVYRPFLAWVAHGNPVFDKPTPPPPLSRQTSIAKDLRAGLGKLLLFVGVIVAAVFVGAGYFDVGPSEVAGQMNQLSRDAALPWPLSWLAIGLTWLLAKLMTLVISLPGWGLQWLLWLGVALLVWLILALPTLLRASWRWIEYRHRVPLDPGASLDYWVGVLEEVGPIYELTLRKNGIWTVRDFLVAVTRPGGLARLAKALGVSEDWITARARQANLMRLQGVEPRRAALLLAAGVDSLATLSQQENSALVEKMQPLHERVGLPHMPPGQHMERWIERAKTLQDVV